MSRQMYRLISISSLKQGSISCLLLGVVRECKSSLKMTLCYISLNFLYTIWGLFCIIFWSSVQFSHLVVSDSLWPHGQQHARPPCPSPTPEVYSNSCPLVGDVIQPSHPLSSPSPPAFNLSQHQGLFRWISSLHQVAKVLEFQLQHQSFQWIFRTDFL